MIGWRLGRVSTQFGRPFSSAFQAKDTARSLSAQPSIAVRTVNWPYGVCGFPGVNDAPRFDTARKVAVTPCKVAVTRCKPAVTPCAVAVTSCKPAVTACKLLSWWQQGHCHGVTTASHAVPSGRHAVQTRCHGVTSRLRTKTRPLSRRDGGSAWRNGGFARRDKPFAHKNKAAVTA